MKYVLFGIGAYLLYQYIHHPPSPPMQPPGGSGSVGSGGSPGSGSASSSVWTGIRWIDCSSSAADPTMCGQLSQLPGVDY